MHGHWNCKNYQEIDIVSPPDCQGCKNFEPIEPEGCKCDDWKEALEWDIVKYAPGFYAQSPCWCLSSSSRIIEHGANSTEIKIIHHCPWCHKKLITSPPGVEEEESDD